MNKNPQQNPNQRPPQKGGKPDGYGRNPLSWLIIVIIAVTVVSLLTRMQKKDRLSSFTELEDLISKGYVKKIELHPPRRIVGEFNKRGIEARGEKKSPTFEVNYSPELIEDEYFKKLIRESDVDVQVANEPLLLPVLLNLLPIILLVAIVYFFFIRGLRGGGGGGMLMNFGRSKHRMRGKEQIKVTFKDVAGIEEAKEEVAETIDFLKNPKKFKKIGGRIPRGVLLVGPPGCGKTLLAKAIAGEADVPFFSIAGSDFVEMFVGVGASRVRDLFKQAKDNSPCIIFLDEIDAIGRKRGPGFVSGGHDEREQTLNAILVEMDGFDTNDQVIVIAATNRSDILDNALTRPGRFDRQVVVPLPDLKGRAKILEVHAKKIKMEPDVNLERIARGTPMFSGAELEALINEAAISASMLEKDYVEMCDLEEARDKVRWGRAKRSRVVDEQDKKITAYHEAGHALVQYLLEDADPLHKVSIIPRGPYGGATFALPEKDRVHYTRKYCLAQLQVFFAGRISEETFCDDITSGAQMDIKQATSIAREMILTWGMGSEIGPINYQVDTQTEGYYPGMGKNYSEKTAEEIDREVKRLIDSTYQQSKSIIEANRGKLEALAQALLKYETLDVDDVKIILEGGTLDKPTVADLLKSEQDRNHADTETEKGTPQQVSESDEVEEDKEPPAES